jgi:hypothetical protein
VAALIAAAARLTGAELLRRRLNIAEIRGPAALAYLDPADFRPWPGAGVTGPLALDYPGLQRFLMAVGTGDAGESGLRGITSPAFAVCRGVGGRRPCDRGGKAAAMAGTARGIPAHCPRPGIPRARLSGEHPPGRCGPFTRTLIMIRASRRLMDF